MKLIIDTDPGQDDAATIMLALGSPEIELLGITAVAGNMPLALRQAPQIATRIKQIVLMGGRYFSQGNATPSAEFNMFADPQAASEVFACEVRIVMMPLDVTQKVLMTPPRIAAIRAVGYRAAIALADMLSFYGRYNVEKYGSEGGPLHDPTTIAWLLNPDLFAGRDCNVEIETTSNLTRGATVVDWGVTERPKNALVINEVDADGFFDLLIERLGNLS